MKQKMNVLAKRSLQCTCTSPTTWFHDTTFIFFTRSVVLPTTSLHRRCISKMHPRPVPFGEGWDQRCIVQVFFAPKVHPRSASSFLRCTCGAKKMYNLWCIALVPSGTKQREDGTKEDASARSEGWDLRRCGEPQVVPSGNAPPFQRSEA